MTGGWGVSFTWADIISPKVACIKARHSTRIWWATDQRLFFACWWQEIVFLPKFPYRVFGASYSDFIIIVTVNMWSVYEGRGYVNLLLAGVCGLASCSTFHLNAFPCTKNDVARHVDPEAFCTRVKAVVAFRRTWFVPRQCDIMS